MLRIWLQAVRAPFFTASVIPVLLGAAAAHREGCSISPALLALTLVGALTAHAGANLANDVYDSLSGADWLNEHRTPFNGGSGVIQSGLVHQETMWSAAAIALAIAAAFGLVLAYLRGWQILALMAVGGASALAYTAGPVRLAYRGWGELLVGLNFGTLLVLGSYFVHAGRFGIVPLIASLPVAFLITAVLFINQFPDVSADAAAGKRNWVVKLGTARAVAGYYALVGGAYAFLVLGVLVGLLPLTSLVALLSVPLAVKAVSNARRHYGCPRRIIPSCVFTIAVHGLTGCSLILSLALDAWL